jgi:acyl carrier protein
LATLRRYAEGSGSVYLPDGVAHSTPFMDVGLDSMDLLKLAALLAEALGMAPHSLPATTLFDYPTVDALSGHLATVSREATSGLEYPNLHAK